MVPGQTAPKTLWQHVIVPGQTAVEPYCTMDYQILQMVQVQHHGQRENPIPCFNVNIPAVLLCGPADIF